MERICIIANNAAYGNAGVLAEGFRKFVKTDVYFKYQDRKDMHPIDTVKTIPVADHYIVVGAVSLGALPKKYYSKGVTMILTDSRYMDNYKKYNQLFAANGFNVWAMPDLAAKAKTSNIYYQPFIVPKVDCRKIDLVCHSPYSTLKESQKGTIHISAACVKNNLPLTIIKDKTWIEAIKTKALHLYCVDQVFRGIGKSGLEAMLLDCAVLSGVKPECDYLPPIKWTSVESIEKDLLELIFDKYETNQQIKKQREWAIKNLDPYFMAQKILATI